MSAKAAGRRYRYGSSFVDPSGLRFEGHHPLERPDLWQIYLEEGEGKYRSRGVEGTMRRRELEDGHNVSLFFLAFDADNNPVAGVRFHGPLEGSHEAAILEEMANSSEIDLITKYIDADIANGVIEVKGAWSKSAAGHRTVLTLSRSTTHAMNWLGAEVAIATASKRLFRVGASAGSEQVGTEAVPFPDERFETIAVSWRRAQAYDLSSPKHQQAMRVEAEQLSRGPLREGSIEELHSVRTQSWRPLILDVEKRAHREIVRALREDDALQIIDRLDDQQRQLLALLPAPEESLTRETPRWAYFPWRRAMVRLLAPRPYARLRLDRNRNKLTRDEQGRLRTLRIGVVGMSAGHSVAHVLAMEGLAGEIRVADFDEVELSNLNRLPASVLDLGVNKAVVAARRVAEIDPYVKVVAFNEGVTEENLDHFMEDLDLVIEECDSLDMKVLVREAARRRRVPVFMETSDRGVLDVERFDLEPDRPLFHGLLGDLKYEQLRNLTTQEKSPIALRILGAGQVSARAAASMFELGQSLTAWPQLASEVTLGAATLAVAVRRFGLGEELKSGRVRVDVDVILEEIAPVVLDDKLEFLRTPLPEDPPLVGGDPVNRVADAARRAPSGGNVQPWRFEASDQEVRFYLVPEKTTLMDVAYRGSYVAIGAALFNARVEASALGVLGPISLFPEGLLSRHVATLQLGDQRDVDLAPLREALYARTTNRRLQPSAPIEDEVYAVFRRGVEREGAKLHLLTDRAQIAQAAAIIGEADRLRFLIPELHREMTGELRWPGRDALDEGLDVRTLELDAFGYAALDLLGREDVMAVLRDTRGGQALGLRTQAALSMSAALAVVTVPRPDPKWYVRGGVALERLWIEAEAHGVGAQPASPVFLYATDEADLLELGGERRVEELYALSERFRACFSFDDGEAMVMVLRLHRSDEPRARSVRLPLDRVYSRDDRGESPRG
ncbi:MAG: Rv1355c family protein [Acidobacteriota bacterium]|nr:Rv1355c family protein [Acidobacteriota bacterium]